MIGFSILMIFFVVEMLFFDRKWIFLVFFLIFFVKRIVLIVVCCFKNRCIMLYEEFYLVGILFINLCCGNFSKVCFDFKIVIVVVFLWKKFVMCFIFLRSLFIWDILSFFWVVRLIVWVIYLICGESLVCFVVFIILLVLLDVRDGFCLYFCKFYLDIVEVSIFDKFFDVCDLFIFFVCKI